MLQGDIKLYLSGGESNNDPTASLGGAKSSTDVQSKSSTAFSSLTGVTIEVIDATCPSGTATFDYVQASDQIRWKSSGNDYGEYVTIDSDGDYSLIDDAGIYVTISVTHSSLPGSDTVDTTTISTLYEKLFDKVEKAEAYSGDVEYRAVYVTNDAASESDYLLSPKIKISQEQDTKESGTASSGSSTTLVDSSKSWLADQWANYFIRIVAGTGKGQSRIISSNTSDTITVSAAWDTAPSSDSEYQIATSMIDLALEENYYEENIGTGDGSTTSFSGTLAHFPTLKKQIEITDGNETFTDWDGDETLTGDKGGTGTFTYNSSEYNVTFNNAPENGATIKAYYSVEVQSIADESTAPTGLTWSHPVTGAELNLSPTYDIIRGKGFSMGLWLRRRVYRAYNSPSEYRLTISGSY